MRLSTHLYRGGNSLHVTIPKPARVFLNWKKGLELLLLVRQDKSIRVVPLDQHIAECAARRAPTDVIGRASTRLFASGSTVHITIAHELMDLLPWVNGAELVALVNDDRTVRLLPLEQHIEERVAEREAELAAARVGVAR